MGRNQLSGGRNFRKKSFLHLSTIAKVRFLNCQIKSSISLSLTKPLNIFFLPNQATSLDQTGIVLQGSFVRATLVASACNIALTLGGILWRMTTQSVFFQNENPTAGLVTQQP
jgi:hypothetical protein